MPYASPDRGAMTARPHFVRKLAHTFACTLACTSLTSLLVLAPAQGRAVAAEFSPKDGQILGRTMGYVGEGMTGTAVIGIVFSPSQPASQREAERVRSVIGDGLPAGRVRLQARLVPVEQLASVSGVDALYMPPEGTAFSAPVAQAAQRLRIPTVSTDMACVESARCIVGFASEPTVQIVISRGAADRAGVRFVQAFRMLVTER